MTPNARIFLNIVATYGRSLYALAIGLFCGRWTLMALGSVDYGLYGVVAGLTAFVTYLNGILGGAIGRFYAVSVGRQQSHFEEGLENCRKWFTAAVVLNTMIPLALVLIGYPVGLRIIQNFLVIPPDRIMACVWVWRLVCMSSLLGMMTVPMSAMYYAKQYIAELTVYSFATTTINAVVVYYFVSHPGDWLSRYACCQCFLSILPQLAIAIRACWLFPECRVRVAYLKCWPCVRELFSYSIWNAWGTLGVMLREQGSAILLNRFFGPKVNAGFGIGASVSAQANSLSGCLTSAFSPAIYNAWGAGDRTRARTFAYQTCRIGTLLVLLFAIPIILEADEILSLWLVHPPQYAVGFCISVLVVAIIDKLAIGHVIVVNANGKVAKYQAVLGTSLVFTLPLAWLLVRVGFGTYSVAVALIATMVICVLGRVWFARSLVGMSSRYWACRILGPLVFVSVCAIAFGCLSLMLMTPSLGRVCMTTVLVELIFLPLSWAVVLSRDERTYVCEKVRRVFSK